MWAFMLHPAQMAPNLWIVNSENGAIGGHAPPIQILTQEATKPEPDLSLNNLNMEGKPVLRH